MWEPILSIVAALLAVLGPVFVNWLQNRAREQEAECLRKEFLEQIELSRVILEEQYRIYYRELNDQIDKARPKLEAEIERMRRGE